MRPRKRSLSIAEQKSAEGEQSGRGLVTETIVTTRDPTARACGPAMPEWLSIRARVLGEKDLCQ